MKKSLLFASFICAALSASAQLVTDQPAMRFAWGNQTQNAATTAKKAAQKADLKDNQVIVGLYTSDDWSDNGLGLGEAITIEVGSEIPASFYAGMNNLKVDAVRFALAQTATVNCVKLYGVNQEGYITEPLAVKALDNTTCNAGWTTVEFDEPVVVDGDLAELLPSYEIALTKEGYPISTSMESEYVSFLCYGALGQNGQTGWFSMTDQYGTVSIQLICSCDPAEGFDVKASKYTSSTVAMGEKFTPTFTVMSTSEAEVSSIDYTVELGGATVSNTATFKTPIPAGFGKTADVKCELTAPQQAGAIPVVFTVNKINGVELEKPIVSKFTQDVFTRIVPRMSIVEEFTGTGCGWCPRGWVGMEKVKHELSDQAAVIAIHQYNNTDPMYVTTYHTPSFAGAPGAMVDRKGNVEPYYGDDDKGIIGTVKRYAAVTPEAAVTVEAAWTDDAKTKIDASATTEFLTDLEGSELVFVLTADGLTGTTSAWKQGNYYASYTASQVGLTKSGDPELYEFCKGGSKGQSSVTLVFNDVLIGSSWTSATTANKVAPFSTTAVGETASSAYTLSLPTKTTLKNALVKDQIYVTAMVIKADGTIANAARCKVQDPAGLNTVLAPVADDAMFDLSGRVNNSGNGVRIQNGKKVLR
ncbi:MAG: hypothetical protein Q4D23_00500 [Bacteroidales bacterium]|nr:hypothetical protein [Bacteroidales bacterium]